MEKTKIDWCDSTWNPVTGCLHGCEYCYARGIAKRFGGNALGINHVLNEPFVAKGKVQPYPFGFVPTFHRYRLNDYIDKKGRNIFVCSMADLFGDWVPDSWIEEILKACMVSPQHNYLFLTKNPKRYRKVVLKNQDHFTFGTLGFCWFGTTVTNGKDLCQNGFELCNAKFINEGKTQRNFNSFLSIEPLLQYIDLSKFDMGMIDWAIIGAETGRRKDKVVPERKWIDDIVNECRKKNIPVFMKSSLTEIWGEPLIQEFPKELKRSDGE